MAQVTPNLSLTVWNDLSDPYNPSQLVDNFVKIDLHDHSGGTGGLPIDGQKAILPDSISSAQLSHDSVGYEQLKNSSNDDTSRAVGTDHIRDYSVTKNKLETRINHIGTVRPLYVDGTSSSYTTLEAALNAAYPGYSPVDGDEIYYQASAGVVWHLRYKSSETYKWQYVGGSSLQYFDSGTSPDTPIINPSATYQVSGSVLVNLPYALTSGVFEIGISATVVLKNSDDGVLSGGLITPSWTSNGGSGGNIVTESDSNAAYFASILTYTAAKATASISKTLRVTKTGTPSLSRSTLSFAQRRQNLPNTSVDFINRRIELKPVAIS